MASNVVFRRVGGRVVPLHLSTQQKDQAKGVAGIAGGVGLAAAAGKLGAKAVEHAAYHENSAHTSMQFHRASTMLKKGLQEANAAKSQVSKLARQAGQHKRQAAKGLEMSKGFLKTSERIQGLGTYAGAGLIAAGVDKLLPKKVKENKKARIGVDAAAGLGSGFAIRTAYHLHFAPQQGLKKAASYAFKRLLARGLKP